ncbi:PREDICTED: putative receptor protein kinase ZmPK1 [Prunus mume]|uniref:non-specific serine/threonine protein kinase n=1 Tax=Prunus mume TaxID=102107 RepID=A0ABM1LKU7_PRUMU|nr:PREDICTED: putative receptor protein kinase ZmPK1 [Prunus mume]
MGTLFLIFLLSLAIHSPPSSSTSDSLSLSRGSSLSVEKPEDVLVSADGVFTAGFHQVGNNSFCFAIWFTEPSSSDHYQNRTIVWMANRDQPVNGKRSKLSLLKTGNLILTDAGQSNVWATTTTSLSPVHLTLQNSGSLVLQKSDHSVLWQSFEFPTDTLLPHQPLTRNTILVSMRSQSNFSSGFYKLFFDNDNLLRLLYDGLQTSSVYWFEPWLAGQDAGRSTDNSSRIAVLDSLGNFTSSDKYTLMAADYGAKSQRRLTVDSDGNVRLYSRKKPGDKWAVSGQVISDPCKIHGVCGVNSVCSYDPGHGRKCSCIPGYRLINHTDWNYGCEPQYNYTCSKGESTFFKLSKLEFFGYDYGYFTNYTYEDCENLCLKLCNCKGFQYSRIPGKPTYSCYPKTVLLNGYRSPSFFGDLYLRHRLLVYEYMEHGSLAQNLSSNVLDWEKRFEIAVGTAKGLAYLHEECLEWVLHCDVKPQNILLDSNYQPKVADFGLSKLFNRGGLKNSSFSRIRGTRGYIAPEWVYNLPITSKVDVYSYGIVVLEMVTGKNPTMGVDVIDGEQRRLILWVREKVNGTIDIASRMGEIIDPSFEGNYDVKKMEILLEVALHCVEEDKDARPTMSQVVEMLLQLEKDESH